MIFGYPTVADAVRTRLLEVLILVPLSHTNNLHDQIRKSCLHDPHSHSPVQYVFLQSWKRDGEGSQLSLAAANCGTAYLLPTPAPVPPTTTPPVAVTTKLVKGYLVSLQNFHNNKKWQLTMRS
jgi:hypothetical protein